MLYGKSAILECTSSFFRSSSDDNGRWYKFDDGEVSEWKMDDDEVLNSNLYETLAFKTFLFKYCIEALHNCHKSIQK